MMSAPTIRGHRDYVLSVVLLVLWSVLTPANAFVALALALDGNWLSLVNAFLTLWGAFNIIAFARSIRAWRKAVRSEPRAVIEVPRSKSNDIDQRIILRSTDRRLSGMTVAEAREFLRKERAQ